MNNTTKIALYAGSFDPFTNGHLDILRQASEIFDKIIIGVTVNTEKQGFIPIEKRVKLIKDSVKNIKNAEVVSYKGLTVDYANKNNVCALIRGVRNSIDFEYEASIAQTNFSINSDIKTILFIPKHENSFISSTIVRELIKNNADISNFVPKPIAEYFH